MRIACPILWFSLLLGSVAAQEYPARMDTAAAETKIIALENAWNQAQLHHDAKVLDSLITDDFVYTDYDGTFMDKPRFLADLKDPEYRPSLVANEGVKVSVYPGAAVVTGTYHTRGTYKGKPFEHWGRFTDTWIREHATWYCVASHTNLLKK
jgi:ketosteroid isomerase-like protein